MQGAVPSRLAEDERERRFAGRRWLVLATFLTALAVLGALLWGALKPESSPSSSGAAVIASSPGRPDSFSLSGSRVVITGLYRDNGREVVILTNQGGAGQDISNWRLCNPHGGQCFIFPTGYRLEPGSSLRVYSGEQIEELPPAAMKWAQVQMWPEPHGRVVLVDERGREVSGYAY